jgi:hypothetical protein
LKQDGINQSINQSRRKRRKRRKKKKKKIMDALKKMGEKLKDGATEFAAKHETEINQVKATTEEFLGKAEDETAGKALNCIDCLHK